MRIEEVEARWPHSTVYPPMLWTSRWSTGDNIPLGLSAPAWVREAVDIPDFYDAGLYLFSHEGHGHRVANGTPSMAGASFMAYNGEHAEAELLAYEEARA